MFNFVLLFFMSIFNIGYLETSKYNIIYEEANDIEIIDEISEFSLVYNNGYVLRNSNGLTYEFKGISSPKLYFDGINLNIFCNKNKQLLLYQFNKQGILVLKKVLFDESLSDNIYFAASDDHIYIASTIYNYSSINLLKIKDQKDLGQRDVILLKFNKNYELVNVNLFGGRENDRVFGIEYGNRNLYIVLKRTGIGGGEFGHGGNTKEVTLICRINEELKLENFLTFSFVNNLLDIKYYKDNLYASFSDKIYKMSCDLKINYKLDYLDYSYFTIFSDNNELLVLTNTKGYLYNLYDMNIKYQFDYTLEEDFIFRKFDNRLYYYNFNKGYYFDIYNLEDFVFKEKYYENSNDRIIVKTLFGNSKLIEETVDKAFNNQVYGKYHFEYLFTSIGDIDFRITCEKEVPFLANVTEDGIYPVGYQLLFSGNAYLNDELVINNYPVMNEGNYQLKLVGADGEEKKLNFKIDDDQIQFNQNKYQEFDIECNKNDFYIIKYKITNLKNVKIKGFVVDGYSYNDFILDEENELLILKIIAPNKPGIYLKTIEQIDYIYNNEERVYKLNQDYLLNVLCDAPSLTLNNEVESRLINVEVNDFDNTIRYFRVVVTSNTEEQIKYYPVNSCQIEVGNLSVGKYYDITISIIYDKGNLKFLAQDIINFTIKAEDNKINLGSVILTRRAQRLESFNININDNSKGVQEIRLLNNTIFKNHQNDINYYYFLIIVVPISILISIFLRKRIFKSI